MAFAAATQNDASALLMDNAKRADDYHYINANNGSINGNNVNGYYNLHNIHFGICSERKKKCQPVVWTGHIQCA